MKPGLPACPTEDATISRGRGSLLPQAQRSCRRRARGWLGSYLIVTVTLEDAVLPAASEAVALIVWVLPDLAWSFLVVQV